jgi:hypothetical protein
MASKIRWDRDRWDPYFRVLCDRLSLKDWSFRIDDAGPNNPDAAAAVYCVEGRKFARIDLSDDFLRNTEEKQRHFAVHEVLHLHDAHEGHLLGKMLTPDQFKLYVLAHEYGHDAIAEAVAVLMPLPSEILDRGPATISDNSTPDR